MDSATWCRTPAAASAARRLRPEVSKNSSTALSSNEGELARSITTCAPAMASLSPSPVMLLIPLLGEAATTSWPPWRRMATVFEPIYNPDAKPAYNLYGLIWVGSGNVDPAVGTFLLNVDTRFPRLTQPQGIDGLQLDPST